MLIRAQLTHEIGSNHTNKTVIYLFTQKQMISTSERHTAHLFAGRNTQQIDEGLIIKVQIF